MGNGHVTRPSILSSKSAPFGLARTYLRLIFVRMFYGRPSLACPLRSTPQTVLGDPQNLSLLFRGLENKNTRATKKNATRKQTYQKPIEKQQTSLLPLLRIFGLFVAPLVSSGTLAFSVHVAQSWADSGGCFFFSFWT